MIENKQQRPILIASFSAFSAPAEIFSAREIDGRNSRGRVPQTKINRGHGDKQMQIAHLKVAAAKATAKATEPARRRRYGSIRGDLHRVIHTIHNAPVDITVDKGALLNGEKAQQNQRFKYHRTVPGLYCDVNTALIATVRPNCPVSSRSAASITLIWNMHRSGAACSLNVTSIGICLSRQQYVVTAITQFSRRSMLPPLTRPECGTIVRRPLKCSLAREPRVFPGTS